MEFSEILKRRRSIRRFRQEEIPLETLKELVEAAALAPSAANARCLRYVLVREKELLRAVLEQTAWGGHVKPYRNPEFGVTGPTAFLAVCTDLRADGKPSPYAETDAGAAIQSVLFRATDLGLGGCWIGAFNRQEVGRLLGLENRIVLYLVGLGRPAESPILYRIGSGDPTPYYLDSDDVIHVPKYTVDDILTIKA